MEIFDATELTRNDDKGPLRIPVLDKMRDRGTVLFGKVESGTVSLGDKISIMPHNQNCTVQSIYNSKEQPVRYAKPGENVRLRLINVADEGMINKGDVVCNREQLIPCTELFEAELEVLQLLSYKPILSKGYQFILHIHTVAEEAQIKDLLVSYEKSDKGGVV